jgi:aspartate racemase
MKTIGLMGGMSWESSIEYYRLINLSVRERLGGLNSAKSVMVSVNFCEVEEYQSSGQWNKAADIMIQAARQIQLGGADFLVICTNTMHKLAEQVEEAVDIPLLHIADATASAVKARGIQTVGLLGTEFTMMEKFYRGRLAAEHGLEVLIPDARQRDMVHRVIYDELVMGLIREESRAHYVEIIKEFQDRGAEGVVLGCTEIGLLVRESDAACPVFDTTWIHAQAAVDFALGM